MRVHTCEMKRNQVSMSRKPEELQYRLLTIYWRERIPARELVHIDGVKVEKIIHAKVGNIRACESASIT